MCTRCDEDQELGQKDLSDAISTLKCWAKNVKRGSNDPCKERVAFYLKMSCMVLNNVIERIEDDQPIKEFQLSYAALVLAAYYEFMDEVQRYHKKGNQ